MLYDSKGNIIQDGLVYFVINGNRDSIKIGRTGFMRDRIYQLRSEYKEDLRCCGVIQGLTYQQSVKLETALHKKFKYCNVYNEWFERKPVEQYIFRLGDNIQYPKKPDSCNFCYDLKRDLVFDRDFVHDYYKAGYDDFAQDYIDFVVERNVLLP